MGIMRPGGRAFRWTYAVLIGIGLLLPIAFFLFLFDRALGKPLHPAFLHANRRRAAPHILADADTMARLSVCANCANQNGSDADQRGTTGVRTAIWPTRLSASKALYGGDAGQDGAESWQGTSRN